MELLLQDGLEIMHNVDNPTCEEHRQLEYWEEGQTKLKKVGKMVYKMHPNLSDMIDFAQKIFPKNIMGISITRGVALVIGWLNHFSSNNFSRTRVVATTVFIWRTQNVHNP